MYHYSLQRALELWQLSSEAKNVDKHFDKYLSLGLRKYVLPAIGLTAQGLSPKDFAHIAPQITVDRLKDAKTIFRKCSQIDVESAKISSRTVDNYRSAVFRFLDWLERQTWWRESIEELSSEHNVSPLRASLPPKQTRTYFPPYGLREDQIPKQLHEEIESFKSFRLTGGKSKRLSVRERHQRGQIGHLRKPKIDKVDLPMFEKEKGDILRFLGWYIQYYSDSDLKLELITQLPLIDEYVEWAVTERQVTYATGRIIASTAIAVAKWLTYDDVVRRDWSDVPMVLELQDLRSEYKDLYQSQKTTIARNKWSQKELSHEQLRQIVLLLQQRCSVNYGRRNQETQEFLSHGRRNPSAIARAWQTYLIVKILVYCPVRQEEVRSLELNKTLFRRSDSNGQAFYEVMLEEHKLDASEPPRHYRLPDILTSDLDYWLFTLKPSIVKAVETVEEWKEFWGYSGRVERIKERLEKAKMHGIIPERSKVSLEDYIQRETVRLTGAENRIAAWEKAKANLEAHNLVFFLMGKGDPESFGKPHYVASVWRLTNRAIAEASLSLFGQEKWLNPHGVRHIGEKHIRVVGKSHIAEQFGRLIGHSKKMGDEYADQIISEYEITQDIVDDWWE